MSGLHEYLKNKTQPIHKKIESDSILNNYLLDSLNDQEYKKIIAQKLRAYEIWQAQLDIFFYSSQIDNLFQVNIYPELLKKDLLGFNLNQNNFDNLPPLTILNEGYYLGCSYVFKGSEIGSKIIYNSLKNNNNLDTSSFKYFQEISQNKENDLSWKQWMNQLESYALSKKINNNDIGNGAIMCFEGIYDWFKIKR
ncbi:MAG: hypothetical protein P1U74_07530 [Legionellaceae bacterium]|nr:hypothetical protein [Legionellaceae bacterium]